MECVDDTRERRAYSGYREVCRFIQRKCRYHSRCSAVGRRTCYRTVRAPSACTLAPAEVLRRSRSDVPLSPASALGRRTVESETARDN